MNEQKKIPHLTARLETVFDMIPDGSTVADIGCDHGFLSARLVCSGKAKHVIASDLREGPLSQAASLIRQLGISDQAETVLADGLRHLHPGDVSVIAICGMGGMLTVQILNEADPLVLDAAEMLVLQPQTDVCEVRRWCHDHGFRITDESMIADRGKSYVVLQARHGHESYEAPMDYLYGQILPQKMQPAYRSYLEERLKKLKEWRFRTRDEDQRAKFLQEITWIEQLLSDAAVLGRRACDGYNLDLSGHVETNRC